MSNRLARCFTMTNVQSLRWRKLPKITAQQLCCMACIVVFANSDRFKFLRPLLRQTLPLFKCCIQLYKFIGTQYYRYYQSFLDDFRIAKLRLFVVPILLSSDKYVWFLCSIISLSIEEVYIGYVRTVSNRTTFVRVRWKRLTHNLRQIGFATWIIWIFGCCLADLLFLGNSRVIEC